MRKRFNINMEITEVVACILAMTGVLFLCDDQVESQVSVNNSSQLSSFYAFGSNIRSLTDLLEGFVDIDGNGEVDSLTHGLLILRFLFGLERNALTDGVFAPDAPRTSYATETYFKSLMPAS